MQFTLSTRNVRGIAANFVAADKRAQKEIRTVVKRAGVRTHALVSSRCPVGRTGHMKRMLRLAFTPSGLTYEVGWDEKDFGPRAIIPFARTRRTNLGKHSFYPVYIIFGTRFQAPNDFLFTSHEQVAREFIPELAAALRASLARTTYQGA